MDQSQSDTVTIALAVISLVGTLATLIVGAVIAIMTNGQNAKIEQTRKTGEETAAAVNGMTHELVTAKSAQAGAEGFTAGEAAERERASDPPVSVVNADPLPTLDKP